MNKDFTVTSILMDAWQKFTDNISFIYYLFIPSLACTLIAFVLLPLLTSTSVDGVMFLVVTIAGLVLSLLATISLLFFVREGRKDTYAAWKNYGVLLVKCITVSLLQGLMILAGLILFIIPGIYVAVRYAFVSYRVLEYPTMSIQELFAAEARATEGKRWTILLLAVIFIVAVIIITTILSTVLGAFANAEGNGVADFIGEVLMSPFFTLVSLTAYVYLNRGQQSDKEKENSKVKEEPLEKDTVTAEPDALPVAEPAV